MPTTDTPSHTVTAATVRAQGHKAKWLGWTAFGLAMLPLWFVMIAAGVLSWSKPSWWEVFMGVCWSGAAVAGIAAAGLSLTRDKVAQVSAGSAGLAITPKGNAQPPVWSSTVDGAVVPGLGAVVATEDGRTVTVKTSDEDAEALVSALGLDPDKPRFESRFRPTIWRALSAGAGVVGLHALAMNLSAKASQLEVSEVAILALASVAMVTGIIAATTPPKVVVGADGISIKRAFRQRFIPFADIASVSDIVTRSPYTRRLSLTLHDGSEEHIAASKKNRIKLEALKHRLELGLAAHADAAAAPPRLALLARNRRDVATWRANLAALIQQDAGFRRSPLSHQDVEAILDDPTVNIEQRIGAALALEASDAEAARPRIRIAAEACAEPKARRALLRVADDGDAELERQAIEEALGDVDEARHQSTNTSEGSSR